MPTPSLGQSTQALGAAYGLDSTPAQSTISRSPSRSKYMEAYGGAPPEPERYRQERDLFGFFVSGLSAIESTNYGLFAIASMLDPNRFRIAEPWQIQLKEARADYSKE